MCGIARTSCGLLWALRSRVDKPWIRHPDILKRQDRGALRAPDRRFDHKRLAMTTTAPSTKPMRRSKKIRTSCPKKSGAAHDHVGAEITAFDPASLEARELEARYRSRDFNATAALYARKCRGNADDLLSAAMVHALRRPNWAVGVQERIEGILSGLSP